MSSYLEFGKLIDRQATHVNDSALGSAKFSLISNSKYILMGRRVKLYFHNYLFPFMKVINYFLNNRKSQLVGIVLKNSWIYLINQIVLAPFTQKLTHRPFKYFSLLRRFDKYFAGKCWILLDWMSLKSRLRECCLDTWPNSPARWEEKLKILDDDDFLSRWRRARQWNYFQVSSSLRLLVKKKIRMKEFHSFFHTPQFSAFVSKGATTLFSILRRVSWVMTLSRHSRQRREKFMLRRRAHECVKIQYYAKI